MTKRMKFLVGPVVLLGVLVGCSGASNGNGVATLSGSASGGSATTVSPAEAEKALVDWVTCMRGQGLDLPDPTVDADGNLTLGGGRGFGGGAGGGGGGGGAQQGGPANFGRFQDATKACGGPPEGSFGFNRADRTELQESALKLSECVRKEGIADFPDPDFSGFGPGAPGTGAASGAAPRGPFGNANLDDPKVQAALDTCRKQLADAGVQLPGRGAGSGASTGSGSGS